MYFASSVPVLHDQEIEPPDGTVDEVAVPARGCPPDVGTSNIVLPPSIAAVVVTVIVPVV